MMQRWVRAMVTLTRKAIDGLVQDCSKSSALAMELLQSRTKSSIYIFVPVEQNNWFDWNAM